MNYKREYDLQDDEMTYQTRCEVQDMLGKDETFKNKKTAYVYVYINPNNNAVVYVGKVHEGPFTKLEARLKTHKRDSWYSPDLKIRYMHCPNNADADTAETHFIGVATAYNRTKNFQDPKNIAKMTWKLSNISFNYPVIWFDYHKDKPKNQDPYTDAVNRMDAYLFTSRVEKNTCMINDKCLEIEAHMSAIQKMMSEISEITDDTNERVCAYSKN